MTSIWLIPLLTSVPAATDGKLRPLFDAIRHVETGSHPDPANARGDGGRSLGPYQISRAYWRDSGVPGRYEMVRNKSYAERVIKAYWQRHSPKALARLDFQALARIHNGGPRGPGARPTLPYWQRVRDRLPQR